MASALGAIILASAATVVLATDVATPASRFHATPDACALLGDHTVQTLIGEARAPNPGHVEGQRRALHRDPDWRSCNLRSRSVDYQTYATLQIEVFRFSGTQLRLGHSGPERADDYFQVRREMSAATREGDCDPLPVAPPSRACGARSDPTPGGLLGGFYLLLQRDNLVIIIYWSPVRQEPADDDPEELMPVVATEVLVALDDH